MSGQRPGHAGQTGGTDLFFADDDFWEWLDGLEITPTGQWVHWLALLWCARNGTTNKLPEPALAQVVDGLQPDWYAELVAAGIWRLDGPDTGLPFYVLEGAEHVRYHASIAAFLATDER